MEEKQKKEMKRINCYITTEDDKGSSNKQKIKKLNDYIKTKSQFKLK